MANNSRSAFDGTGRRAGSSDDAARATLRARIAWFSLATILAVAFTPIVTTGSSRADGGADRDGAEAIFSPKLIGAASTLARTLRESEAPDVAPARLAPVARASSGAADAAVVSFTAVSVSSDASPGATSVERDELATGRTGRADVAAQPAGDHAGSIVQIRSVGCGWAAAGTGYLADDGRVITNRHVVNGASEIRIIDQAGNDLAVGTVRVLRDGPDFAVIEISGSIPGTPIGLANANPGLRRTNSISIAGHPGGRALESIDGTVVGDLIVPEGRVLELDVAAEPGSSGSPVLDRDGRVIGLVYAQRLDNGNILALPADRFPELLASTVEVPATTC